MNIQLKNHIASYFSDIFIDAVQNFQELVQRQNEGIQKISRNSFLSVYQGNSKSLVIKQAGNLSPGYNKNTAIQFTVLRVIWTKLYTFVLCTASIPLVPLDIFCIVIETAEFQAPLYESWKKLLGPMAVLFIKEPYLELDLINNLQIIRILIQNAQVKKSSNYKAAVNQTKTIGNEFFNKSDFISALHYYQYGLSCCHNYSEANTRAILYSNSAASLYRLNLFDTSLKYCAITNKADANYYKVNAWKIRCLLEKKLFGEIPNLLVLMQSKANTQYFENINLKYSIYLSNSLGMYNWKAISSQVKKNQEQIIVADYFSKYIGLRMQGDRQIYYALQTIKKHSILIIRKPLIFDKKGMKNKQQLYEKVIKFLRLQKNILPYHNIKLDQKQIQTKIRKYLVQPNDITNNQTQALGFWPQLTKFTHNCSSPNSSIVHFQSIMLISTCQNISQGQHLTIDLVSTAPPFDRKQILYQKYNILCKCAICQRRAWPDMDSKDNVVKFAQFMSNITIRKQVFWEILIKSSMSTQVMEMIQNQAKVITKQISWTDMIRAMRFLRQKNTKLTQILTSILILGFKAHLKIPNQLALQVINNIR